MPEQTLSKPEILLTVQDEDVVVSVTLDYHGGEQYPALVRVEGTPDFLGEITKPLTQAAAPAAK